MPRSPRWARKAPAMQVTLIAVEYARKGKVYLLGTAAVWEIEPALPKGLSSLLSLSSCTAVLCHAMLLLRIA